MIMQSTQVVICVIGPPCSGKSTLTNKLKVDDVTVINVGNILRNSTDLNVLQKLTDGNYIEPKTIMHLIDHKLLKQQILHILGGYISINIFSKKMNYMN